MAVEIRGPAVAVALVLSAALAIACADDDDTATPDPEASNTAEVAQDAQTDGIPDIVDEVEPSVVAVTTVDGEGSGVVYDDDVIVTNAHVVGDADTVEIRFADGTTATAQVVAADPVADLAVVRTEQGGLPVATFADEIPEVGALAVAIGNPLGFENTATAGIVSGLERAIPGGGSSLAGLLQTDAPISPGNSGGALVGDTSEVIGINVAYIPPQGGAVSIGFAIPAPLVVDVADELLTDGQVDHAFLGIRPATLTPQLADRYGFDTNSGILVLTVEPGGPADTAGIRPGDVIVQVNGDNVDEIGELLSVIRSSDPGDTIALTVRRDGQEDTIDVELGTIEVGTGQPDGAPSG
jgi:serine protease DegQ